MTVLGHSPPSFAAKHLVFCYGSWWSLKSAVNHPSGVWGKTPADADDFSALWAHGTDINYRTKYENKGKILQIIRFAISSLTGPNVLRGEMGGIRWWRDSSVGPANSQREMGKNSPTPEWWFAKNFRGSTQIPRVSFGNKWGFKPSNLSGLATGWCLRFRGLSRWTLTVIWRRQKTDA